MTEPLNFTVHRLEALRRVDRERLLLRLVVRNRNTWRACRPVDGSDDGELETLGVADGRALLTFVRAGLVEAIDEATGDVVRDASRYVVAAVGTLGRLRLTSTGHRTLADWSRLASRST